jgi:hypothetical protein
MRYATVLTRVVLASFLLGASATFAVAQTVRVTAADATIYLNPDASSPAMTVVKAGTLLETAGLKGEFFIVVLPADASGLRRMGYIAASAVEPVAGQAAAAPAEPAAATAPAPFGLPPAVPKGSHRSLELGGYIGTNRNLTGLNEAFATGLALGGLYDVTFVENMSSPWTAGVTFGAARGRYVVATAEFAYTHAADSDFTAYVPYYYGYYYYDYEEVTLRMRADLYEMTFGAHVNIPVPRVTPYVGGGAGAVWLRIKAEGTNAAASDISMSDTSEADWTAYFAVGARIFITERFGVRPEYRAIWMPDLRYSRFGVGVFTRF